MATEKICAICSEGHLHLEESENEIEIEGKRYSAPMHMHWCDSCGTKMAINEDIRFNARAVRRIKKKYYGLLTGEQVRECRKSLRLNQEQAARLFGGGPVAFSKYENDEITQSDGMDRLIWLISRFPSLMIPLAHYIGMQLPSRANIVIEKVKTKFDEEYFFNTESDVGFEFNHKILSGFELISSASNDGVYQLKSGARPAKWKVA